MTDPKVWLCCPDCGAYVAHEDGDADCPECGWSGSAEDCDPDDGYEG